MAVVNIGEEEVLVEAYPESYLGGKKGCKCQLNDVLHNSSSVRSLSFACVSAGSSVSSEE